MGVFRESEMIARRVLIGCLVIVVCSGTVAHGAETRLTFRPSPGQVEILAGEEPLATYVYRDAEITRPYFAHLHAPGGRRASRNHPPREGQDDTDHGTAGNYFHPGMWLAFSNVNGNDYWRLKARVDHLGFEQSPSATGPEGSFTVRNAYRDERSPDTTVFEEVCRYHFSILPTGYLLVTDSLFLPQGEALRFGDEEEMGLGFRVHTPIAVKHGGSMQDSADRRNEAEIWGHEAAWCEYQGEVNGRTVGIMLIADPENGRTARLHARDYGLMTLNPFGRRVFGAPRDGTLTVAGDDTLRLRFAVLLYTTAGKDSPSLTDLAEQAMQRMADQERPTP